MSDTTWTRPWERVFDAAEDRPPESGGARIDPPDRDEYHRMTASENRDALAAAKAGDAEARRRDRATYYALGAVLARVEAGARGLGATVPPPEVRAWCRRALADLRAQLADTDYRALPAVDEACERAGVRPRCAACAGRGVLDSGTIAARPCEACAGTGEAAP